MNFGRSTSAKPALRHVTNRYGVRQEGRTTFLRTTADSRGARRLREAQTRIVRTGLKPLMTPRICILLRRSLLPVKDGVVVGAHSERVQYLLLEWAAGGGGFIHLDSEAKRIGGSQQPFSVLREWRTTSQRQGTSASISSWIRKFGVLRSKWRAAALAPPGRAGCGARRPSNRPQPWRRSSSLRQRPPQWHRSG